MQRFLAVLLVLILASAAFGFFVLQHRHGVELAAIENANFDRYEELGADAAAAQRELAEDLVRVLSMSVADDVAGGDMKVLEERLAEAVQGNRLVGVLVLSPDGAVLSSTDLRFRGRVLDDEATRLAAGAADVEIAADAPAPGQVEVVAPLLVGGERVGFMRAFVQVEGPTEG
jgi:hypothetical protein